MLINVVYNAEYIGSGIILLEEKEKDSPNAIYVTVIEYFQVAMLYNTTDR